MLIAILKADHSSILMLIFSCLSNIRMLMMQLFLQRNGRIFANSVSILVAGIPFQFVLYGINSKTRSRVSHLTF